MLIHYFRFVLLAKFMMLLFAFHFLNLFFFATTFIWKLIVVLGANMCLMLEWQTTCHHSFSYKSRMLVKAISFHLLSTFVSSFFYFFWWHHFTIENCINWGATIMGDENPFSNGGIMIIVISSSIMKQIHIKNLSSSIISQKKIAFKAKIRSRSRIHSKHCLNLYIIQKQNEER